MPAASMAQDPEKLQAEVERLVAELQEATREKVQAAQYGLAVLEENGELKQRCGELEGQLEVLRMELVHMKEALAESHSSHKRAAADGESREECLLRETASKEACLTQTIEELQNNVKHLRSQLDNNGVENERIGVALRDLRKERQILESEKARLCEEMKQVKTRELCQLQDCAELEEENISLQKQVSVLKSSQVEFESIKHALSCREEELVLAGTQLLELGRLRDLAEHQLQEALEALQAEREQKQELRRELAISTGGRHDSLSSLQANLEELNHSRAEEQDSGFANASNIGSMASTPHSIRPAPGLVADLFSELNLAEIHKLQQQLLQAENEKASLASDLQDLKKQLSSTQEALAQQQLCNNQEVEQFQTLDAGPSSGRDHPSPCEKERFHEELEKAQLAARQEREAAAQLEMELRVARRMARESQSRLAQAQEELLGFSEEMAALYHHVCACHSITPQRVVLDYYREGRGARSMCRRRSSRKPLLTEMETSSSGDQSPASSPSSPCGLEPLNVANLTAILREQLRHLQVALSLVHQQGLMGHSAELERDKEALVEEVLKLKSLLSTKREQIATLRTVLKANKQTAEAALSNLKGQFEGEKVLVSETMAKLRHELKALKEDAATFCSLRAMFASRLGTGASQGVVSIVEKGQRLKWGWAGIEPLIYCCSCFMLELCHYPHTSAETEDLPCRLGESSNCYIDWLWSRKAGFTRYRAGFTRYRETWKAA
ncbi:protein bicaudal D homolog 2 isoform X1 [Zootoca vivipara]|uniref:protein bicaudal D homolog 2 isoform X1 n=1 Tax=Zootoca vivipara TaxID=8524 RepID=UPI00293BC1F7|nr:protein bicaudal D homolog 2 isoform X1 [Zootoca vivipara]XP_034997130.2 protein bicaudal D homolog 2 isoform X1 [Zootoca vivipara]XP_060125051.1 protein bicaudal D homolog 2 isoform X1 [Zootoca vivipara]XP_060125052.1 protein bicaudal D homolog 2 isoform X1 [Zootoca vivipara]